MEQTIGEIIDRKSEDNIKEIRDHGNEKPAGGSIQTKQSIPP